MSGSQQRRSRSLKKVTDAMQQPILGLAESGRSSREIEEFLRFAAGLYFRHKEVLSVLHPSVLNTTVVRLRSLERAEWMPSAYSACLRVYRTAEEHDAERSMAICHNWGSRIRSGELLILSAITLRVKPEEIGLDDLAFSTLQSIGTASESLIKPHLQELLEQAEVGGLRPEDAVPVEKLSYGQVVGELGRQTDLPEKLLAPEPWGIRLNQWRNIAQHISWSVRGEMVECWYGKEPQVNRFHLSRDELLQVRRSVTNVELVLMAARAVYLLDRPEPALEVISRGEDGRIEARIAEYGKAVASFGFEIVDIGISEEQSHVIFRDVTGEDPDTRREYVLPFVYHLCKCTGASKSQATYEERDGTPNLQATASAEDCAAVAPPQWEELARRVELVDLRAGRTIHSMGP